MAYKELTQDLIDAGIVFVSKKEAMARIGVTKTTLWNHINKDYIDGYSFRNRTYFLPDDVEQYEKLHKCGLLG